MSTYANILGTLIIGSFFNAYLYGVASVQYVSYCNRRFNDSWMMRAAVLFLFLNDTFQTAAMIYMAWVYCVANFGQPSLPDHLWPYAYVPIGTALTAVVTHLAMAHRIYYMSKSMWLYGALILASLGSLGTGVAFGVEAWTLSYAAPLQITIWKLIPALISSITMYGSLKTFITWWLCLQAFLDIVIACFLILFLHRQRTGGDPKMDSVINCLIRGAVQSGLLPLLFAIAGLVAFLVRPNTNLYIMFVIPIGRTYTTSFMGGLNVRGKLKEKLLGSNSNNQNVLASEIIWRNRTDVQRADSGCNSLPDLESQKKTLSLQRGGSVKTLVLGSPVPEPIILHSPGKYRNPWDDQP